MVIVRYCVSVIISDTRWLPVAAECDVQCPPLTFNGCRRLPGVLFSVRQWSVLISSAFHWQGDAACRRRQPDGVNFLMEVPTVPILYLISHRDLTMTSETFSGPVNTRMKKEKLLAIATALALDPRPSTVANIVSKIKKHLTQHPELAEDPKFQGLFVYRATNTLSKKQAKKSSDKTADYFFSSKMTLRGKYPREVRSWMTTFGKRIPMTNSFTHCNEHLFRHWH